MGMNEAPSVAGVKMNVDKQHLVVVERGWKPLEDVSSKFM